MTTFSYVILISRGDHFYLYTKNFNQIKDQLSKGGKEVSGEKLPHLIGFL